MPLPKYRNAARLKCKLAMAIDGLSGMGKTGLALAIGQIFADGEWKDVYVVDTENHSVDLYVGTPLHTGVTVDTELKVADLLPEDGYKPSYYHALQQLAISERGKALINDSLSHSWQYEGGILSMVTAAQVANPKLNKWTAWGTPEIVAEKNAVMSLVRSPHIHIISTLRTKEKMEMVQDENGKNTIKSLGEQQIIMPDFKYEPDLVVTMVDPGDNRDERIKNPIVKIVKSRYRILQKDMEYQFSAALIHQLKQYLEEGTSPEELFEQQRQDYITGVTEYLNDNPSARMIWKALKENLNVKDMKLEEMPLNTIKVLYSQLVAE